MTSANTTTATTTATMASYIGPDGHRPRRWAVSLAVRALLGLAILTFLGAEFGTQVHAAGQTVQDAAVKAIGGLDSILAGIRWVR